MPAARHVQIEVVQNDALAFAADVLVLKHAQGLYGVDDAAYRRLSQVHDAVDLPPTDEYRWVDGRGALPAARVLFLGVGALWEFDYVQIREFGRRAIALLAHDARAPQHVALTLHGVGYGLDEVEAFKSELAGVVDALSAPVLPPGLARISFVERDARRAQRLAAELAIVLPTGRLQVAGSRAANDDAPARDALQSAGSDLNAKPHVFVAMPFAPEMDDVFHYGIQGAINAAGMLAERADLSAFTGDVMEWVKARIASAELVVADLSSANANVYLEVGYAWGRGVATVLLTRKGDELKFDVRGQRCILYASIKELETRLAQELKQLPIARR